MGRILIYALPLSISWVILAGQPTIPGLIVGYAFGIGVLLLIRFNTAPLTNEEPIVLSRIPRQLVAALLYSLRLAWDVFVSGASVAWIVIQPRMPIKPAIQRITTQDETNNPVISALSAHSITITPGELVIDFEEASDETHMLVHTLNKDTSTEEKLVREQQNRLATIKRIIGRG